LGDKTAEHDHGSRARLLPVASRLLAGGIVRADLDAGPMPGFLVWSATCYPGWSATLDGRAAKLERTNHAFFGLAVPPGKHILTARFKPFVFRLGLYLSLLAGLAIALGLALGIAIRGSDHYDRKAKRIQEVSGVI